MRARDSMILPVAMGFRIVLHGVVLLWSACSFGQLPLSGCDAMSTTFKDCASAWKRTIPGAQTFQSIASTENFLNIPDFDGQGSHAAALGDADAATSVQPGKQGFHWARAFTESFTFLVIEQAYVVHTDLGGWYRKTEYHSITFGATTCSRSPNGRTLVGTTAIPIGLAMLGIPFKGH